MASSSSSSSSSSRVGFPPRVFDDLDGEDAKSPPTRVTHTIKISRSAGTCSDDGMELQEEGNAEVEEEEEEEEDDELLQDLKQLEHMYWVSRAQYTRMLEEDPEDTRVQERLAALHTSYERDRNAVLEQLDAQHGANASKRQRSGH